MVTRKVSRREGNFDSGLLRLLEQEIEALRESIDNFATELVPSGDPEREQLAGKLFGVMGPDGFIEENPTSESKSKNARSRMCLGKSASRSDGQMSALKSVHLDRLESVKRRSHFRSTHERVFLLHGSLSHNHRTNHVVNRLLNRQPPPPIWKALGTRPALAFLRKVSR
jgi:hypothetical protein